MCHVQLINERKFKATLERRRNYEAERRGRIFNYKLRTIGVDKEGLDMQVKEKQQQEERHRQDQEACDAEQLLLNKRATLLHRKDVKQRREMEKGLVTFRAEYQQRPCEEPPTSEMFIPGLAGEDPGSKRREEIKKEQFREWLFQQQNDQEEERRLEQLKEQLYNQQKEEEERLARELECMELTRRKEVEMETINYNLAKGVEDRCRNTKPSIEVGMLPGIGNNVKPPLVSVEEVTKTQSDQIKERKKMESDEKQVNDNFDQMRLDMARTALLIERKQAKLRKQLRRDMDCTNSQMVYSNKDKFEDLKTGAFYDSFFDSFNTCSR